MALYAFDGTWNKDSDSPGADTNVVRFRELYGGPTEYVEGIGTRFGAVGRAIGGIFGAGGRSRVGDMYEELTENWKAGDRVIDIVGFSRGAALALHFANKINDDGIDGVPEAQPRIRFLGLWDVVGSFGLSFDTFIDFSEINLGWDIDQVAGCVDRCAHAMSLDERRETFPLTRLDKENRLDNVTELWFRGVHSDVGGGNENTDRSNIALQWMLGQARLAEVPIKEQKVQREKYSKTDPFAPISENRDPKRDEARAPVPGDEFHPTALGQRLADGESVTVTVSAERNFNYTNLRVRQGERYAFSAPDGAIWKDGGMKCGIEGWTTDELPWFKEHSVRVGERWRRIRDANWFQLCGSIGDVDDDDEGNLFAVDRDTHHGEVPKDGLLYLFANDVPAMTWNNKGELRITLERIG